MVSIWEPARSLVGDACLWGQVCPLPSGSGCDPPASLPPAGDGPVCCQLALLWYLLSPLFSERGRQCLRLELFMGKFSLSLLFFFFFLSLWLSHSLRSCLTLAPSDCPQGIQAQALAVQPVPPCSAPACWWWDVSIWAISPLGVGVRCVICGFYLFIFFLPVMLPSEIPKLPQTCR